MIRSSKHILNYQTKLKSSILNNIFSDYKKDLEFYIDLILSGKLPLKKLISSKDLPTNIIKHSGWKSIIYKQASEIIRSQSKKAENKRFKHYQFLYAKCKEQGRRLKFLSKRYSELNLNPIHKTKYFTKPNIENITIILDNRLIDFQDGDYFDEFIRIKSPYFHNHKKRSITFNLPIKHHKHSNKFKDWNRKKSIQLSIINNNYYVTLFYEKEDKELKTSGNILGIDQGYKKLITCSNGEVFGQENFQIVYNKLNRKQQGSKSFKRTLTERDNLINQCCNQLNLQEVKELVIEDLKNVKHKTKKTKRISTKFMNKLQRWSYIKTSSKLERLCQENGILFTKVNPAYTSQKCSECGRVDKKSREGERYFCQHCGYINDADVNAAINISRMGIYRSHSL